MMLIEKTAVPAEALPVAEFRDHLRLGTGFADLGAGDAALLAYLRAAIAAIEMRTAKVLLQHEFTATLDAWRGDRAQPLPVAPVSAIAEVRLRDAAGVASVVTPSRYRLVPDMSRPRLQALAGSLPGVPTDGNAEIDFVAGFGPAWADLPVDLAQAVFLLAAQYYELRHEGIGEAQAIPFGVMALIEPWRTVRMLGGSGMSAPRLNRPLVLERAERVADGAGGHVLTWVALGTLWAEVKPGTGRERAGEFVTLATVPYRITVRAAPEASPSRPRPEQRLREGDRVFRILAVSEADRAGLYLTCFTQEEVVA